MIHAKRVNWMEENFASGDSGSECDPNEDYVRNTTKGCVRGFPASYNDVKVEQYLGIPYAQPPIGNRD